MTQDATATYKKTILKSLVGSRAHGLHTEESDYDYRGVYVLPTSEILSLGFKYSGTSWIEGEVDDTSYEIGHFLQLCTKANPSVLEVLISEVTKVDSAYAQEMRDLLPYMFTPQDAFNAFAGYSKNQQKKLLDNHLGRKLKFGVAYVRTAFNLLDLFQTGSFSLEVTDSLRRKVLLDIKGGKFTDGEILNIAETQISLAKSMLEYVENKQNLGKINQFLLKVRKENW